MISLTRFILAVGLSTLFSYIASRRNRDEVRLRAANDELERRVRERTARTVQSKRGAAQLADELLRSNERLQQTNEELERFAYIAPHDLQLLRRYYKDKLGAEGDEMLS